MLFEVGSVVQVKVTDLVPVPFQMHLCMRLIISFLGEGKKGQGILQSSSSALRSIRLSFPHGLSPPAVTGILISSSKSLAKSVIGSPLTCPFMELPSCKPLSTPFLEFDEIGVGKFEALDRGVVGMEDKGLLGSSPIFEEAEGEDLPSPPGIGVS